MTVESLSMFAGAGLQLLLAYVPKLNKWYAGQSSAGKAGVMAVALLVVSLGVFAMACTGLSYQFNLSVACTKADALNLTTIFVSALVANQSTYLIGVKPFKK